MRALNGSGCWHSKLQRRQQRLLRGADFGQPTDFASVLRFGRLVLNPSQLLEQSGDVRAGYIFKALADFSESGQVIVFTHHKHLCEVARQNVDADRLAVVEIMRT